MARYAETLKNRVVAKLLPPESASVSAIAKEVGVDSTDIRKMA